MQFSHMSEREWDELPFWQRVNRRALGLVLVTVGLMLALFLPLILGVLGDIVLGDAGAVIGIFLGLLTWVWLGAALVEGTK